uniref:HTH psq-type domain-containing protein n=1 Tax=Timema cristinae TaxID=61476 RepID=A0A7R9GPH7_TIMCR|nr:unnamed protein product [Timema cristinae]
MSRAIVQIHDNGLSSIVDRRIVDYGKLARPLYRDFVVMEGGGNSPNTHMMTSTMPSNSHFSVHFTLVQSECRVALLTHWISLDPLANLGVQVPASLAGFYCEQISIGGELPMTPRAPLKDHNELPGSKRGGTPNRLRALFSSRIGGQKDEKLADIALGSNINYRRKKWSSQKRHDCLGDVERCFVCGNFHPAQDKLEILRRLSKGESGASLAKIYGVGTSTISDIKAEKDSLQRFASKLDSEEGSQKIKTTRTAKNSVLEESVLQFVKNLSLKDAIYMVADAWGFLTDEHLKNAWEKLWLIPETPNQGQDEANSQTPSDANTPTDAEVVALFQTLPGFEQCDELDAREWFESDGNDPGYQHLNDDKIVHQSDDDEEMDAEEAAGPSHSDAYEAFQTAINWLERQPEGTATKLVLLKRLRDMAVKKQEVKADLNRGPLDGD